MPVDSESGQRFERAVAVKRLGPGRYAAAVDPGFNGPVAPNGGVLAATMTRAAEAELGPGAPPPRSISAHYLSAPAPGAIELHGSVLRAGRRVSFVDVRMLQHDRLVAQATVIASRPREATWTSASGGPPPAPPAQQVAPVDDSGIPGRPPIFDRLEMRPVFGPGLLAGGDVALAGGWLALRDDDAPLDAARLCALCDVWWPAVFSAHTTLVGVPTLALTVHLSTSAAVRGPVLARFETLTALEGHVEESGQLWSADGRLLAESRQLALLL